MKDGHVLALGYKLISASLEHLLNLVVYLNVRMNLTLFLFFSVKGLQGFGEKGEPGKPGPRVSVSGARSFLV